jgi:hypothetical protein
MAIITYNVATTGYFAGGGQGALEEARFYLTSGTTLKINVGYAGTSSAGGGGGGATSVWVAGSYDDITLTIKRRALPRYHLSSSREVASFI